jgi:hypothetical protein
MKLTEEQNKKVENVFRPHKTIKKWKDGNTLYYNGLSKFIVDNIVYNVFDQPVYKMKYGFKFKSVKF